MILQLSGNFLRKILSADDDIVVVGTAADPYVARDKIKRLNPDVITLDVEMPKMDGISFLRNLMRLRPMPVIMISSLTEEGADAALEALGLGAIDFVRKPKVDIAEHLSDCSKEIINKVKAAASANILPVKNRYQKGNGEKNALAGDVSESGHSTAIKVSSRRPGPTQRIIAIGASTGGTEAIKEILTNLSADSPGMVISQHIPKAFSTAFAKRMNSVSPMAVCEAEDGQHIEQGHVYIAPGDKHLRIEYKGGKYRCVLDNSDPVNRHKPSVDVMFQSIAQVAGKNSIGVILTGMGADGARGLGEMRDCGAVTIAQDEGTSVVWGMPGAAVKCNAVDFVLPLAGIAQKLIALNKVEL